MLMRIWSRIIVYFVIVAAVQFFLMAEYLEYVALIYKKYQFFLLGIYSG